MNQGGDIKNNVTSFLGSSFLNYLCLIIFILITIIGLIGWIQLECVPSNWELQTMTILCIILLLIMLSKKLFNKTGSYGPN